MNETKLKGLTTELYCQLFFTSLGYNVSVPLSEDCKYDLIVDIKGKLYKIQVKTCCEDKTGIKFSTKSSYLTAKGTVINNYNETNVDFFATYYKGKCYLIPFSCCGSSSKKLTFKRKTGTGFIEDYEALKVISELK